MRQKMRRPPRPRPGGGVEAEWRRSGGGGYDIFGILEALALVVGGGLRSKCCHARVLPRFGIALATSFFCREGGPCWTLSPEAKMEPDWRFWKAGPLGSD